MAKVVLGTTTVSSSSAVAVEPTLSRTPMTVKVAPLTLTVWPTGGRPPNSSEAVVAPTTATSAASALSAAVKKRPCAMARLRTCSQLGVEPTTEVVQFVDPATTVSTEVDTGATPTMSGATEWSASMAASPLVSVVADPRPPRTPEALVVLPGETMSRFDPSLPISSRTWSCAPWPRPTVSITAAIPMRIPSVVRTDLSRRAEMASSAARAVSAQLMPSSPPPGSPARGGRCRVGRP